MIFSTGALYSFIVIGIAHEVHTYAAVVSLYCRLVELLVSLSIKQSYILTALHIINAKSAS